MSDYLTVQFTTADNYLAWMGKVYRTPDLCKNDPQGGGCSRCLGTGYDFEDWEITPDENILGLLFPDPEVIMDNETMTYRCRARMIFPQAAGMEMWGFQCGWEQLPTYSDESELVALFYRRMKMQPSSISLRARKFLWTAMRDGDKCYADYKKYAASLATGQVVIHEPGPLSSIVSNIWGKQLALQIQDYNVSPPPKKDFIGGQRIVADLIAAIPALADFTTECPVCYGGDFLAAYYNDPATQPNFAKERHTITRLIPHLNDRHHMDREDIAAWLETLPIDLTFQSPQHSL